MLKVGLTGSIAVGKNADLVLLDENPLVDVNALRMVQSVVKFGKYYDRKALDAMLKSAHETKLKLDNETRR